MLAARGTVAGKVASGVFVRLSLVAALDNHGEPSTFVATFFVGENFDKVDKNWWILYKNRLNIINC